MNAFVCLPRLITAVVIVASGQVREEQLFRSWEKAKADTHSLIVDFTLETRVVVRNEDRFGYKKEQYEGTFKMLRTAKGEVLASCNLAKREKPGTVVKPGWFGLLNSGKLYLLDAGNKTAMRFTPATGNVRLFLEEYVNPFFLLLDEEHARANYSLGPIRQDRLYTYLSIEPKQLPSWGAKIWFERAEAVFMNTDSHDIPKDMPRQLRWEARVGGHALTIKIHRWKVNTADGPKAEEFTCPEDRRGWQVMQ